VSATQQACLGTESTMNLSPNFGKNQVFISLLTVCFMSEL
jgi:hypothetical protein